MFGFWEITMVLAIVAVIALAVALLVKRRA